jgi:hypothetical protein
MSMNFFFLYYVHAATTYCALSCSFLALIAKLALKSSKYFVFRNVGSLTFLSNMHPQAKLDIGCLTGKENGRLLFSIRKNIPPSEIGIASG